MTTMDPLQRLRPGRRSRSVHSLVTSPRTPTHRSPLSSPPMCASPTSTSSFETTPEATYNASLDQLLTLPRPSHEPLVSFLLRSIFNFPPIFSAIQSSVVSLCRDPNLDEFMNAYADDDGEALVYVALLYAMGQDIRRQQPGSPVVVDAPDRLPYDITFREAIGISHLAELFDLDSLRAVCTSALEEIFSRGPVSQADYAWAFGRGSRIVGQLTYKRPDVPVKIELVERFTRMWDDCEDGEGPKEEKGFLRLGRENVEFYLLVKSFCLGNVNGEGVNDISPVFLTKWMHAVRKGNVAVHKS